jgi:hypothetical protein
MQKTSEKQGEGAINVEFSNPASMVQPVPGVAQAEAQSPVPPIPAGDTNTLTMCLSLCVWTRVLVLVS